MIRTTLAYLLPPLALLYTVGCGSQAETTASSEPKPRPVRTAEARALDDSATVFSGSVRSAARSRLSFQVPGSLSERSVELGDVVRRGQLIARLDPTDFRLRVQRAESAVKLAEARLREAEATYGRTERLYADDNATRAQLDAALAALEVAASGADAERRALELARRDLGHTRLEATDDGTIVDLFVEAGEVLGAGQTVATLAGGGALEIEWTVPEGTIAALRPGLKVEAQIPAVDARFDAVITEVGTSPRDGGATYPIRARLAGDVTALPGMAAEIRLRGDGAASSAVLLPPAAVTGDPGGHYVLVVEGLPEGSGGDVHTVRRRGVDVGTLRPEGLEVLSGLLAGERVVTAGVTFLADGERVQLLRNDPLAELPSAVAGHGNPQPGEAGR